MRLIKYADRRLYCSNLKRFVTIKDVVKGLRHGVVIRATCAKTRMDITEEVLVKAALYVGIDSATALKIVLRDY